MKFRILIISLIAAIAVQYPAFSQEAEISEDKVYELMFTDYEAACKMMEQPKAGRTPPVAARHHGRRPAFQQREGPPCS